VIRVLLIEDLILLRTALTVALASEDGLTVVGAVGSVDLAATTLVRADANVAVVDLDTRRTSASVALHMIAEHAPHCCVLALTRVTARAAVRQALEKDVAGFLHRDCEIGQLVDAIRRVAAGERFIEPGLAVAALSAARSPLTLREMEVLRLAADGHAPADIAAALFLTSGTVRNYLSIIMRKLGARSRLEAVSKAQDASWL
jgi:two-component system response regulator DesR